MMIYQIMIAVMLKLQHTPTSSGNKQTPARGIFVLAESEEAGSWPEAVDPNRRQNEIKAVIRVRPALFVLCIVSAG